MAKMKATVEGRVRGTYGKPWSRMANIPVTSKMLHTIGKCMAKVFAEEAVKDFQKRGWSQKDPSGGGGLKDSFGYKLKGRSTVEITCTFYGVAELANEDIPAHPMPWLTQHAKDAHPAKYKLSQAERDAKMKKGGRVSQGTRRPLVVPIQTGGGVIFRTAPLKFTNAWVHPGIAKFTFTQRAVRRSKEECMRVLRDAVADYMRAGDPTS